MYNSDFYSEPDLAADSKTRLNQIQNFTADKNKAKLPTAWQIEAGINIGTGIWTERAKETWIWFCWMQGRMDKATNFGFIALMFFLFILLIISAQSYVFKIGSHIRLTDRQTDGDRDGDRDRQTLQSLNSRFISPHF